MFEITKNYSALRAITLATALLFTSAGQVSTQEVSVYKAVYSTPTARLAPLPAPKPKVLITAVNYARGTNGHDAQPATPKGAKRVRGLLVASASPNWKVTGLRPDIMRLLNKVQRHYGKPLHIISGCRSKKHNRKVRGAKRSQHLHCKAADFKISGVSKHKLVAYLKSMPGRGGVGLYCRSSYVHLDTGPKRDWYHGCGKRRKHRAKKQYASARTGRVGK